MNRSRLLAAPLIAGLFCAGLALAPVAAKANGAFYRPAPRVIHVPPAYPPRLAYYPAPRYHYPPLPAVRYYVPPRVIVRPPVYFGFTWGTSRHWRPYHHPRHWHRRR